MGASSGGNEAGFTLLEMLVAALLSSVMLLAVFSTFISIRETVESVSERREVYEAGRVLIELIGKDVRGVKRTRDTIFVVKTEEIDERAFSRVHLLSTSFLGTSIEGQAEIGYFVYKDEDGNYALVREESFAKTRAGESGFELIKPVEEFRVWAYDGSSYLENWDSKAMGRLPKGIRMEIKLKSRSGQSDVTFSFEEEISS